MMVTEERKAELLAILEEALGLTPEPLPKPKVVATSELGVIRDADVQVAKADPNYRESDGGMVKVRRSDFVTINMSVWEEQQRQKRLDKQRLREIDPFRMGHWNGE
jgi:hypothetical protein